MLLLFAIACTPCEDPADLPIVDPQDRLGREQEREIQDAYDDFMAWTAAEGLCVERVRPGRVEAGGEARTGSTLAIDPETWSARRSTFLAMCAVLDAAEGHSEARPDLFGDERWPFATQCGWGPPRMAWRAEIQSACGTDMLDARERYLADHVYTAAPKGRNDGPLRTEPGTGALPARSWGVQFGDRVLINTWDEDDRFAWTAWDPETGEREVLYTHVGHWADAVGGPEGAAVVIREEDRTRLVELGLDGRVQEVVVTGRIFPPYGVHTPGSIWGSEELSPLVHLDLRTGARTERAPGKCPKVCVHLGPSG